MRYVHPRSVTWWSGILAMATGVASMSLPESDALGEIARLVSMLAGGADTSPAGLIFLGLGLIGLRDRVERGFRGDG